MDIVTFSRFTVNGFAWFGDVLGAKSTVACGSLWGHVNLIMSLVYILVIMCILSAMGDNQHVVF
jgi:hypothetical protein